MPDQLEKQKCQGEKCNFIEWIVNAVENKFMKEQKDMIDIVFVSDNTELGYQFSKGFTGVAAFLKFPFDYSLLMNNYANDNDEFSYQNSDDEEFI